MKAIVGTTTGFHLRRLAVELQNAGDQVLYLGYNTPGQMRRAGLRRESSQSLFGNLLPDSLMAAAHGSPWQRGSVRRLLAATDRQIAKRMQPADVYVGLSAMAVASADAARERGAVVVIDRASRHVNSQHRLLQEGGRPGLDALYIKRELESYARADYVCVPSAHAADSFLEEGFAEDQIFTCNLGVQLQDFTPSPRPAGPLSLLFIGSWSFQKGADVMVTVMRRRPDWHLTHVGTVGDVAFPHDLKNVSTVGTKSHSEIAEIMRRSHILVLPSRQDGFGMVILEALAAGLPVVGSTMTGAPDVSALMENPEWVEVVQPGDPGDLARGIQSCAGREASLNTPLRDRLSEADRQNFSWTSYGLRYREFLGRVVK